MKELVLTYSDCRHKQQIALSVDGSLVVVFSGCTIQIRQYRGTERYKGVVKQGNNFIGLLYFDNVCRTES